jgi:signal transduction histidine kinase/ActR/RegA family two-component response regulator
MQTRLRKAAELALLAAVYFATARAGLALAAANKNVTAVWPPTGIAVSALVLRGFGVWPAITVGAFLANLDNGAGWAASLLISMGNTMGPLAAAYLLKRRLGFRPSLERFVDVLMLMGIGGLVCMLISATWGTTTLLVTTHLPLSQYWSTWLLWWVGDSMGVILFSPAFLTTASMPWRQNPAVKRPLEAVSYLVILTVCSWLLVTSDFPLRSLAFPLLVWGAVRFRQQLTAVAVLVVTAVSVGSAVLDPGTLPNLSPTGRLLALDLFSAAIAVSAQTLAAVEAERVSAEESLQESTAVLEDRVLTRTRELAVANQNLEQARAVAEDASRAKSDYLSRMSHELRTPLTAIIGFAELKAATSEGDDEHLRSILRAADHLEALVEDALDIARIESGRIDLTLESVDMAAVCEESIKLVSAGEPDRAVRTQCDFPDRPYMVVADAERLSQVVTNLVSNGYKYGGGVLKISLSRPDGHVRLNLTDQGAGLSAAQLGSLFQPFERVGAERSGIQGTGLGLALSKALMDSMGGVIGVESEVGRGSTFWIELNAATPALELHRPVPADVAGETAPVQDRTILSIEDNPSVISLLKGIINLRPNLRLITVPTGGGAFQAVLDHKPDLVLLDLHLPDTGGEEILQTLKSDSRTSGIAVVVLSADANPDQVQTLLNAGAEAYLTKPIRIATFLSVVDKTLESSRPAAAQPAF